MVGKDLSFLEVLFLIFAALMMMLGGGCPVEAQTGQTVPLQWTRVPGCEGCYYELGSSLGSADEWVTVHSRRVDYQWNTGTLEFDGAGPWYFGVRVCIGDAAEMGTPHPCSDFRLVRRSPGSDDFGPWLFADEIVVPMPGDAWRTD